MIIIDGRQTDMHIENFANLEEILVEANTKCTGENRIVTDVLLNNEQFTEIYPHQAEDLGEMALNISDELFKVTRMMCDGSSRVAGLFRRGDDQEALELFQDLLDVTRDFMSMVGVLRSEFVDVSDPQFSTLVERVSELLGEMSEVLSGEDWILLADLLEFEFNPVCEAWNKNLEKLRADIARRLD